LRTAEDHQGTATAMGNAQSPEQQWDGLLDNWDETKNDDRKVVYRRAIALFYSTIFQLILIPEKSETTSEKTE